MILAVIDTNVLVSALLTSNPESATRRVLDMLLVGDITPLYNGEVIEEYLDVLSRSKFHFDPAAVHELVDFICERGMDTARTPYDVAMPDEDDRVFFEISLTAEESFLVTGNLKHYPCMPRVVTPADFLRIVRH